MVAGRPCLRLASARPLVTIDVVKGVILAGGKGTRLHPLTRITNKHLLPIYDRPMVTYAIEALVNAGLTELMLVTGGGAPRGVFPPLGSGPGHRTRPASFGV